MKNILISIFLIIVCNNLLFAQNDTVIFKFEKINFEKRMIDTLNKHIKTLNEWEKADTIPSFFYMENFDSHYFLYWKNRHQPYSFRREIIDSTNNVLLLKQIINSKDKRFTKLEKDKSIPFSNYSIKQLCEYRLNQILNYSPSIYYQENDSIIILNEMDSIPPVPLLPQLEK